MIEETSSLDILKEVARIATSSLALEQTLYQIIEVVKNKMRINACSLFLLNEDNNTLRMEASSGFAGENLARVTLQMGQGITGWAAQHKQTVAWKQRDNDPRFKFIPGIQEENYRAMLSTPISKDQRCIGVLNVHTHEEREFSENEISMLETVANQVSGCIQNAVLYSKSQMHLKELRILYEISLASQSSLKMEHGFWFILSGLTRGEAGGFNRAILFMLSEQTQEIHGVMGLGPDSPEDAHRIWASLDQKNKNLTEWVITEADQDEYGRSRFNTFAKNLRFPLMPDNNVFAESILLKKPMLINDAWNHPLVSHELKSALQVRSFAVAPLIAHSEAHGLIYVDNRYNDKPIREEDMHLLMRFATHACWVVENTRLFSKLLSSNKELLSIKEQLIESEKFSALGELSAEVAHEIKNPLMTIGGFARRLKERIGRAGTRWRNDDNLESAAKYSEIIVSEVARLETLLNDILLYTKTSTLNLEEHQLNQLVEEVTQMFRTGTYGEGIRISASYDKNIGTVFIDRQKIKQVLINVMFNAVESMPEGGDLRVSTYEEEYVHKQKMAVLRVEDSGCGIQPELFTNIFNPFFTTKDKGTGLGLSICRKIVDSHGGIIRVENNVGKGVSVFILFPSQKMCDYTGN